MRVSKNQSLNFVDLFAGAGGLSRGLEMAGMKCVLGVDFDKAAMRTFKRNHAHAETYVGDISKLTRSDLIRLTKNEKVHLVCGGPPCQGMSTVGEGIPDDPRNFLFLEFVRIVKILNPDYIVLENVTGMVGRKNENILKAILKQFGKLGYRMDVNVLRACDYGVPQKRRRTIIIGNKKGYDNLFPVVTHGQGKNQKKVRTVGDAFDNIAARNGVVHNHDLKAVSIRNATDIERLKRIPEGRGIRYEEDERELLPRDLWMNVDWKKMDEGRFRQTKYQRLNRKEPSPTIMTGRYSYFHPTENRRITVREAAAIQSFPNDFVFEGTESQQFRQIGNAVPPLLAKAIGESIFKMHVEKPKHNGRNSDISRVRKHAFHYREDNEKNDQKTIKEFDKKSVNV